MGFIREAGEMLPVLVGTGKSCVLGTVLSMSAGIQMKMPIWNAEPEKYPNLLTLNWIISAFRWVFHVGHFISQTAESDFAI